MSHSTLYIYTAEHCPNCANITHFLPLLRKEFPHINVITVDIDDPLAAIPETVFATPTYLLNGRIVSMGNPSLEQLRAILSGQLVDAY